MPRVSVLMLTFNRPQFIGRAIESVCWQTCADWELLVIHDGPNEQTREVVEEWVRRDPRIRYLRRRVPGNIAQANNHGLEQARGDLVAVLDDDDYWRVPEKLAEQVRFLDAHPDHVACGGGAVCIDLAGRETMRYLKPLEDAQIRKVALLANPMVHSTTLYRRAAARDCGFYDETLAGFQDWDLFLKLGQRGRLANLAEYLLCYQIWEGSGSFSASKANTRSAIRIVKRHRAAYRGYPLAILSAYLYHFYSHWPTPLRRVTYSALSRAKKALFSRPAGRGQGSASG